jgi:hypothetical protein
MAIDKEAPLLIEVDKINGMQGQPASLAALPDFPSNMPENSL